MSDRARGRDDWDANDTAPDDHTYRAAKARLDEDRKAEPLTEIVAIMPESVGVGYGTVHAGQAIGYEVRSTQATTRSDMRFEVYNVVIDRWTSLWHAYANPESWDKLCDHAYSWIGPVRMLDKSGLVVREFWPCHKI